MRPMSRGALVVAACGLLMTAAWAGMAPRVLAKVASRLAHVAASAGNWTAGAARADDMKFEALPPESSSSLERRRARTSVTRAGAVTPPPAPAAPAAPEPPDASEPATVTIGKTGDIMRVGSDIEVGKNDLVTGDVLAVGGNVTIQGHVEGNAVSVGGDISLQTGARIDGDVVCMGGELHEDPGVVVGGKRVVGLGNKRMRAARSLRSRGIDVDVDTNRHRDHGGVGGSIGWLLVWLMIGWGLVKIAPGRTSAALESFRRGSGTSFLVGWLALVLTVPALIAVALLTALLCITLIGIPLGIALIFAYFLFLAVFVVWGGIVGMALVGERVAMRRGIAAPTIMRAVITGVLVMDGALVAAHILQSMGFIPFFSGFGKFAHVILIIANCMVGLTGWGALLHSEFTTGILARWWHGRRAGSSQWVPAAAPAAPAPVDPAPMPGGTSVTTVTVPVPVAPAVQPTESVLAPPPHEPAPPSPPEAFKPPAEGPPPPTPES